MASPDTHLERKVWQVSDLNHAIKNILETEYAFIWVTGEITDCRMPLSGHCYFVLKDKYSQISAVMFKGQLKNIKLSIENGMKVLGFGRISVYEPRGAYQIILEYLEPAGIGSQLIALEQLKKKLAGEGLFQKENKKPIPFIPKNICLITSPSGAAVHDFIKVMSHRFPNIPVEIIPVRVQGQGAELEIASAIQLMNQIKRADVGILARGGGSSEDLSVFNSETVARAIFASEIPVVSAIGHEIDFTIADLTADMRAPTPSAAAEMVVPEKRKLQEKQSQLKALMLKSFEKRVHYLHERWTYMSRRLKDPTRKIEEWRLRLDDLQSRLIHYSETMSRSQRERLNWRVQALSGVSPFKQIANMKSKQAEFKVSLFKSMTKSIMAKRQRLLERYRILLSLGPLNILSRGYSITRLLPDGHILSDVTSVSPDRSIEVILRNGSIDAQVTRIRRRD